jgi:phage major head subunit gpT-like protein
MPAGNVYSDGFLDSEAFRYNFAQGLEAGREQLWAARLAFMQDSDKLTETYNWLGHVPVMREWNGARALETLAKYTLSITNKTYEASMAFSIDDLRRDHSGQLARRIQDLGLRAVTHWNKLASTMIQDGTGTASGLSYDGVSFFDTDHNESGSNQSNDLTATEIPEADVGTAASPTATEAAGIINEAVGYAATLTDDRGEPINQDITGGIIMCSKHTIASAFRQAIALPVLASGATNPTAGLGMNFQVMMNPRLTDADEVYVFFDGGATDRPLIFQEEQAITPRMIGAGSELEFAYRQHVVGIDAVRGIGYGRWQRALYIALS